MTLLGEYRHVVDTKNRLFIPAKFREELGETFYITRKIMEKCLAIYSEAEWQKFSEKLNTLPDSKVGCTGYCGFPRKNPCSRQPPLLRRDRQEHRHSRHWRSRTGLGRKDLGCDGSRA